MGILTLLMNIAGGMGVPPVTNHNRRARRPTHRLLACAVGVAVLAGLPAQAQAQDRDPLLDPINKVDESRFLLLQAKPRAYAIVEAAGRSDSARVRLAALEAAEHAPDAALGLVRSGLTDENPAVRFAALVTIGKLQLNDLSQAAIDLMRDDNPSVRAAAIFAAKRCGRDINLTPLAQMLASGDGSVRANAAMLIGQLGDREAIVMLREMATQPMPRAVPAERTWVRLQFAEAMIRLDPDDEEVLGSIRAAMYSNLEDVRVLAIQILGEVSDQSVLGGLSHIVKSKNPIQVRIAAAQSMLKMGDAQALPALLKATRYDEKTLKRDLSSFLRKADKGGEEARAIGAILKDPAEQQRLAGEVRAQAARALGWAKNASSVSRLTELMDDPAPIVQVAAAAAVLRASR